MRVQGLPKEGDSSGGMNTYSKQSMPKFGRDGLRIMARDSNLNFTGNGADVRNFKLLDPARQGTVKAGSKELRTCSKTSMRSLMLALGSTGEPALH